MQFFIFPIMSIATLSSYSNQTAEAVAMKIKILQRLVLKKVIPSAKFELNWPQHFEMFLNIFFSIFNNKVVMATSQIQHFA